MVTYQRFTQICFEVARSKGMESSQENSQALISTVAEIWREQKATLNGATISEARSVAEDEIVVR